MSFLFLRVLSHYFIFGKGTRTGCPERQKVIQLLEYNHGKIILYSFFSCSFPGFLLCIHCFSLQKWRALWGYSLPQVFDHKKIKGEKESILSYHSLQSRPSLSHPITTLLFPFILFQIPCPTPFKRKSTSTVCLKAPCMSLIKSFFKLESSYRQNIIFLSTFPINENKILKMKNCSHQCKVIPSHQI